MARAPRKRAARAAEKEEWEAATPAPAVTPEDDGVVELAPEVFLNGTRVPEMQVFREHQMVFISGTLSCLRCGAFGDEADRNPDCRVIHRRP